MISPGLAAMEKKISAVLSTRPECFITHPSELNVLKTLSAADLEKFALDRGWRIVSRIGGRQIEFYTDATARAANEM
jgi:hypothetical protein